VGVVATLHNTNKFWNGDCKKAAILSQWQRLARLLSLLSAVISKKRLKKIEPEYPGS